MKTFRALALLIVCVLLISAPTRADDTEIFSANPALATIPPNVLIVIDNSANWSSSFGSGSRFSSEIAALSSMISTLGPEVNVGLMMFGESGGGNSGAAYVRFAVRNMNATNKSALQNLIQSLSANGDKSSNAPYGFSLFEAYKYFGGGGTAPIPQSPQAFGPSAFGGAGQAKRDYAGNGTTNTAGAVAGNAFTSAASTTYVSPIVDACQKNYIVIISNGMPQSGADNGSPSASTLLQNIGGSAAVTTIPLPNSSAQGNIADEYARFLYQTDASPLTGVQNIITYTVQVYDPAQMTGGDTSNLVLLESIANQGHGRYFAATNPAALTSALQSIFTEVQSVNSVFASVALPVSVNVRGTNLNQVYLGLFRADPDASPRWFGNLKQYQLAVNPSTGSVFLADSASNLAESAATGFIVESATSFWSTSSSFWNFSPRGSPLTGSDAPDGAVVEKGGAAQRIRDIYPFPDSTSGQTRNIYTCTDACLASASSPLSSYPFNTTTIAPALAANISAFGAASSQEVSDIINWVRGKDNVLDENLSGSNADIRPSVHGDVLHSRPAVINYNRSGNDNDVVVFYGSNDGMLRALKGGTNSTDGYEKWAFVMKEFYGRFKRLRDNAPAITASAPKPYFADGSIGVYQVDVNNDGKLVAADGDKVYIYLTMRRGGRVIYALDVSDPDTPKMLWRRDSTSAGYGELGQTWSEPKVRKIRAATNPVLIFGGGYDSAVEDQDPVPVGVNATTGRGIFIVDALSGNVLWQAGPSAPPSLSPGQTFVSVSGMTYPIPSDTSIVDRNNDGYADRIYVGDTGGSVWRVDISDVSIGSWTVNKLASVGFAQYGTTASRRKFLYAPDVVYGRDAGGPYDAVLIGAGDREHPFNGYGDAAHPYSNTVTNRYYMFKDRSIGMTFNGTTLTELDLYDTTSNLVQLGTAAQQTQAKAALTAGAGWYITLTSGEKVVSGSVTLAGAVFFNTNQPSPPAAGVCTNNLGIARNYAVAMDGGGATTPYGASGFTSTSRFQVHAGGGYPPTPVPVFVLLNGKIQQVVVSGTTVLRPPAVPLGTRVRTFWKRQ